MADTLALRRRIKTAQNISKTTRAMQMIAASKLKKAQSAVVASRPYVDKLSKITFDLASKKMPDALHPYLNGVKLTGKTLYIFIGPDKGLCGGMINNLIREYFKVRNNSIFITIGKKMQNAVASSGKDLIASFVFGNSLPKFEQILPIIEIINQEYLKGNVEKVRIISTHFNGVFSQVPEVIDLLPVYLEETPLRQGFGGQVKESNGEFMFEPSKIELLPEILKRYMEMVLYQQFLESYASYNAAQMIAMQNATNNAKDIVSELQLLYNKARQEKITKEILDISSASVALSVD